MQHKCTICGTVYKHGADEILNGCTCGNKLFYFVKDKKNKKTVNDVGCFYEMEDDDSNEIIVFDLETINIKGPGKYELDLNALLNNNGLVYRYADGKYSIDLLENLKVTKKK
jgi:predicted  nucleic acid-binding Zn-ribbon protein